MHALLSNNGSDLPQELRVFYITDPYESKVFYIVVKRHRVSNCMEQNPS